MRLFREGRDFLVQLFFITLFAAKAAQSGNHEDSMRFCCEKIASLPPIDLVLKP